MREIEGIEEVLAKLEPHWNEIEAHFAHENEQFKAMLAQDHDLIGRVLKCHLIIEHYLDRILVDHYNIQNIEDVKLSYFQKAKLLPDDGAAAAFVKPGILRLNAIRNQFGHTLRPEVQYGDLGPINTVLEVARRGVQFNEPIDAIEAFTSVTCVFLIVPPQHLEDIFMDAFSELRVYT